MIGHIVGIRHAIVVLVHGTETGVGVPGLVKVQVVHALAKLLLDVGHIVAQPVIGRIGKGGHLDPGAFQLVRNELVGCDFFVDAFF